MPNDSTRINNQVSKYAWRLLGNRFCAYCPDNIETGEVKECVEEMQRLLYVRDEVISDLTKELIKIRAAYHKDTGREYKDGDT